jgi:diguanylate cyclase (GGDEF)-like protein
LNGSENKLTKVSLQLSWLDQFQFAGYYIAKEKGFYKDAGLDVDIKPFEFGIDIPQSVSDGKFDFAVGRETLILEKTNGKDIVALYALFQASPLILISTKESGINKITDFTNKRIMTTIDDASEVSIKSMITSQKLDIKNLNFIKHTHNINDLIEKNTDIISAYTSKSPYHLEKMGIEYNTFAPKDYGFDMYSDLLYTSNKKLNSDFDTVMKFKKASLKGWEYAYSNIDEVVELILEKYNSQNLTKEELLFEAKELKKLSFYNSNELGQIDLNKLQRIYDLYNVMGLVENNINIEEFVYLESGITVYLKKIWRELSRYSDFPYIYLFIGLFVFLIILVFYKHIMLYKMTKELKKTNEKFYKLYMTDQLTELYNRYKLDEILSQEMTRSKRYNDSFGIIILDIDYFKQINDKYGHLVGDKVLIETAKILKESIRETDTVGRWGGEEFLIICPHTDIKELVLVAKKIKSNIEKYKFLTIEKLTASFGVSAFKPSDTGDSLLAKADEALYEAKEKGRNRVEYVD